MTQTSNQSLGPPRAAGNGWNTTMDMAGFNFPDPLSLVYEMKLSGPTMFHLQIKS
jgi:hypothetical protein